VLFQTPEFLVLFIISILGIAVLRKKGHQHLFMALLSYTFYAWWDVRFLVLLLITSLVDYAAALGMDGVKLSVGKRAKLSGFVVAMAAGTLLLNWPAVQHSPEPLTLTGFLNAHWQGMWLAMAACVIFAVIWPVVYGALYSLPEERRRKMFLVTSVVCNLAVLGFFKYYNFSIDSAVGLGKMLGYSWHPPHLEVLLPVGISFYTFVSMSYTIDAYRKQLAAERSFLRFSLFVCYYPHLVAGPIIRPENFFPTMQEPWKIRGPAVISGFHLMLNGFVKKVPIADAIAPYVDQIFQNPMGLPSYMIMLGAALFAVQIYCDFSGYSDIARGISRMFGVELPMNFDYPYFSTGIVDFWRRWHISLSTWLRDYLYIPLGGSRVSVPHMYFNLFATMVLGGLWHGASWNFVIWGAYQGALLVINRLIRVPIEKIGVLKAFFSSKVGTVIRWAVTMYFVLLGWLIFRVTNFEHLWYCMKKFVVFDFNLDPSAAMGRVQPFWVLILAGGFMVLHAISYFTQSWTERLNKAPVWALPLVYAVLAVLMFFFWPAENAAFIYFQF
jgi:alginate O-acetyltransferase complex protein AlgI